MITLLAIAIVFVVLVMLYILYRLPFHDIEHAIDNQTAAIADVYSELKRMNDFKDSPKMDRPKIDPGFTPWRNRPASIVTDALDNPLSNKEGL